MLVSLFGPLYLKPQNSNSLPPAPQGMQDRHGLKMSIWFLEKGGRLVKEGKRVHPKKLIPSSWSTSASPSHRTSSSNTSQRTTGSRGGGWGLRLSEAGMAPGQSWVVRGLGLQPQGGEG